MKKILLASTALVLSAGLAHAQAVRITGEGRMGIQYSSAGFGGSNYRQENRLTLNFNVSVEADHGLTFGAWSRARMQVAGLGTAQQGVFSGSRVWVEANGLRLTFGNQDGAFRQAGVSHGYAGGCGVGYEAGQSCGDDAGLLAVTQAQNSTGSDNEPMTQINYSMGDTRVALSYARGGATEFGVRSRFDAFTVALGYTSAGAGSYALSGHYNGGSWGAGLVVARINGGAATNYSLSGNVALGGGNAYAYIGRVAGNNNYGLSYGYGLGGGATLTVGAERAAGTTTASVGVAFNF
ncbi:MAG: porin [Paracoccaceae bacterium]